jgi:hypothetical protein
MQIHHPVYMFLRTGNVYYLLLLLLLLPVSVECFQTLPCQDGYCMETGEPDVLQLCLALCGCDL